MCESVSSSTAWTLPSNTAMNSRPTTAATRPLRMIWRRCRAASSCVRVNCASTASRTSSRRPVSCGGTVNSSAKWVLRGDCPARDNSMATASGCRWGGGQRRARGVQQALHRYDGQLQGGGGRAHALECLRNRPRCARPCRHLSRHISRRCVEFFTSSITA